MSIALPLALLRPIRNLAGDIVVIEVWDSDEETVSVADIKGVNGLGQ